MKEEENSIPADTIRIFSTKDNKNLNLKNPNLSMRVCVKVITFGFQFS